MHGIGKVPLALAAIEDTSEIDEMVPISMARQALLQHGIDLTHTSRGNHIGSGAAGPGAGQSSIGVNSHPARALLCFTDCENLAHGFEIESDRRLRTALEKRVVHLQAGYEPDECVIKTLLQDSVQDGAVLCQPEEESVTVNRGVPRTQERWISGSAA